MSAIYVKLAHNDEFQTVALFNGLNQNELNRILKTVFSITGTIVAFCTETGVLIPLSLVCRSPEIIGKSVCTLIVQDEKNRKSMMAPGKDVVAGVDQTNVVADEISSEYVMQELHRFIEGLREREFLTESQCRLLIELLFENSTLLFSAYSVAISAQDSEYLAEICKDLAQNLLSSEGRVACEAQDEVLQVCDQLYINSKITENQLLYLRHLVLIRDESVAAVYDEFQEHQNVPLLAKSLFDLSNTHPYQQSSTSIGKVDPASVGSIRKDCDDSIHLSPIAVDIGKGLTGVVALMIRSRVITKHEASLLLEMIKSNDDYVVAAYELFIYDHNLEELQDTLLRCVKLETRKRFHYLDSSDVAEKIQQSVFSGDYKTESMEDVLKLIGVKNVWDSVPENFVKTVFEAVHHGQLKLQQGSALCDLFHAQYDLVVAAWEVFTVQDDHMDFIDTLRRIVRDLSLNSGHETVRTSDELSRSEFIDHKSQAQSAVANAKRDLLLHSLEMMVKQHLTTEDNANTLYAKYLNGDSLTAVAIETYANDRDVSEFLDTLQVLANTSQDVLNEVMKGIMFDKDGDFNLHSAASERDLSNANEDNAREDNASPLLSDTVSQSSDSSSAYKEPEILLSSNDQFTVIEILTRVNAISASQCALLENMINHGNDEIRQLFLCYERNKDVHQLIESLKQIASNGVTESNMDSMQSIESRFLEIVQSMSLTHLETAALRLAIARNDTGIRSSIEQFRSTMDEESLKKSLKDISKMTIDDTSMENNDGELSDRQNVDNELYFAQNDANPKFEQDEGIRENSESDSDDEKSDSPSLMTSKTARVHVFPILVSELVKENIISSQSGSEILRQFNSDNNDVSTALDLYDIDNDMGKLVDTLQQIVNSME